MMNLQCYTDRFKAGVYDILSNSMTGKTSIRAWFDQLRILLLKEFQVESVQYFYVSECQLRIYEKEELTVENGEKLIGQILDKPFLQIKNTNESVQEGDIIIPCFERKKLMGVVCIRPSAGSEWMTNDSFVLSAAQSLTVLFENVMKVISTSKERKRYHELFEVTEAFNSIMDVNEILFRIIVSLQKTFPEFRFTLLLSDDHDNDSLLPIEHLDYQTDNPIILKAFVTSEVLMDDEANLATLYAPLKGKQGVYGLLQAKASTSKVFTENDKEFIKILSYTAGNALENAKLYQQSQRLIEDLQLINDLSHQLNSKLNLKDMMSYLYDQMSKAFSPSAIGFVLLQGKKTNILDSSCQFFKSPDGEFYLNVALEQFINGSDALYIADLSAKVNHKTRFQSLMAVPMIHDNQLKGFSIVLHEESYFFTFEMYKLMQSIIHHSSLAVANSMLREEMEEMINKDHLTDLFARNYLDQYIEQSMIQHEEGVFVLIDIDDFKSINDTYGHQIGDEVIIQLADELKVLTKAIGIGARWGGEELALYFPNISLDVGMEATKNLLELVPEKTNPNITISCGVTSWERNSKDSLIRLVKRADDALYEAKNNGKNRIAISRNEPMEMI